MTDVPTKPVLKSHYAPPVSDGDQVFLLTETQRFMFEGKVYADLLPFLDGRNTPDEILDALEGVHRPEEVYYALLRLAQGEHLTEGSSVSLGASGAYWDATGRDPALAGEKLRDLTFHFISVGLEPSLDLRRLLEASGLKLEEPNRWDLVATDDYLHPDLEDVNRASLERNRPWVLFRPVGLQVWLGPLFVPGDTGCWECLAHRLKQIQPLETHLASQPASGGRLDIPRPALPGSVVTAAGLLASVLTEAVGGGDLEGLREGILCMDTTDFSLRRHPISRRPQCSACGSPTLYTARAQGPVRLKSARKRSTARGGYRSATPRESFRRFSRHLSPNTGIIKELRRHTTPGSALIQAYTAGPNIALRYRGVELLKRSLGSTSNGKGVTRLDAKVSAMGESLERYSGVFFGDEPMVRGTLTEVEGAIHPNVCMHFSEDQYLRREEENAVAWLPDKIPVPFDPDTPVDWTPLWSLSNESQVYLPTMLLYYDYPTSEDERFAIAVSNGAAAGNSFEEAVLHGILELVERDAVAIWWYNRVSRPSIAQEDLADPYSRRLRRAYRRLNREWWVLDLTTDLGIPTFAAVTRRTEGSEEILLGLGAHLDPRIALRRALTEMNQVVALRHREKSVFDHHPKLVRWVGEATGEENPYLLPSAASPTRFSDLSCPRHDDLRDDVEWCRKRLEELGMEVLVLDQTRPEVEVPVARVVVPQLRHIRPRFAPGRLQEVPVRLGWLESPTAESDMNPESFVV